jgi:hypothetical protein
MPISLPPDGEYQEHPMGFKDLMASAAGDAKKVENTMVEVKGSGGGSSGTVKFKVTVQDKK